MKAKDARTINLGGWNRRAVSECSAGRHNGVLARRWTKDFSAESLNSRSALAHLKQVKFASFETVCHFCKIGGLEAHPFYQHNTMDDAYATITKEGGYTRAHHEVARELFHIVTKHLECVSSWQDTRKVITTVISNVRLKEAWNVVDANCALLMFLYLCGFTSSTHGKALLHVQKFDLIIQEGIMMSYSLVNSG
ncbi:hypothetical protein CYMTET_41400 [Cymbomonas tetramitiformis]|uniref:Uncharacterized protein n=1 Tax=Cymbomonas tetramitiformis TaxID=36881 RepID=A0AAE0C670_9CHLO|nr:hypothetical protein CYMTET_41400 [Cymbomonas tetramitiformis]